MKKPIIRLVKKIFLQDKKTAFSVNELMDLLELTTDQNSALVKTLTLLKNEGFLSEKEGSYQIKPLGNQLFSGTIFITQRGFGFVQDADKEIFIPQRFTLGAISGDTVQGMVLDDNKKPSKGPAGKIIKILKRKKKSLCVIVTKIKKNFAIGVAPQWVKQGTVEVNHIPNTLRLNDRIIVAIDHWGKGRQPIQASYQSLIGNLDSPKVDCEATIQGFGLRKDFSDAVLEEVKALPIDLDINVKGRKNLTDWITFTIDPKDAKDFDDALSIEKTAKGYQLGVHIADVSHFVKAGSQLDHEAFKRGNSTYLPEIVVPMLPKALSNELCSLKPNVVRYAVSVIMQFDTKGSVTSYEIIRSSILSSRRFTYEEAQSIIEGKKDPLRDQLLLLKELTHLLKQDKIKRGCFDFALPEWKIQIDAEGVPSGYHWIPYDLSHSLVEECMLKANELIATHLLETKREGIFRVHEPPAEEDWKTLYTQLESLGLSPPKKHSLDRLITYYSEIEESDIKRKAIIALIRTMKVASYSSENIGHFGLSLEKYCHFTSPIRRYSDLIIHRLLMDEPLSMPIEKIAKHCSEKERLSFSAEISHILLKKIRYLTQLQENDPELTFEGRVMKKNDYGISIDLPEYMLEAFIPQETLTDFNFNPPIYDTVLLKIKSSDLVTQTLSWTPVNKKHSK